MRPSNETLRVADQAVSDWLSGLTVDYGDGVFPGHDLRNHPIFRVFAAPERAFAEMRALLIQQQFITPSDAEREGTAHVSDDELRKQIPMPFCRIQRGDVSPVNELHSTPNEFITASRGLSFTKSRWPTPYEITYTVEFASKARFTDNYITEWMIGQFTTVGMGVNQRLINATYPDPYGLKQLTLSFSGGSDASDLEVSGAADRRIRTTFNVTLRVWDVDLVGKSLRAVMGISTEFRTLQDASLAVGDLGTLIEGNGPSKPNRVYKVKPVPARHSCEHSTAKLLPKYDGHAQSYLIDDDALAVETVGMPFLPTDAIQGAVRVAWRRRDSVKPAGNLRAQILWRDSQNQFAPTVLQELSLAYADAGAIVDYQSVPGSEFRELSVRFLRPASGPALVVGMTEQVVYRTPINNVVPAPDRTKGPGLGVLTDVSVSGLARAEAYLVRAYVQYGSQPVTLRVYTDAGATELVASRVFSASGEFTAIVSPTNSQLFLLRITTGTADAALQVTGITAMRCRARPLLAT